MSKRNVSILTHDARLSVYQHITIVCCIATAVLNQLQGPAVKVTRTHQEMR